VIGVLLDCDKQTLTFYLNGRKQNKEYQLSDTPSPEGLTEELFPAVSMINPGESVCIELKKVPED
jgi:hypothetical protein